MSDEVTEVTTAPINLRDAIFSASDIKNDDVFIPEWGVTVRLRTLSALERTRLVEGRTDASKVDIGRMYANIVIATVYDPTTNEPIFTPADREAIMAKSGAVIDRIAQRALASSGLGEEAVDAQAGQFPS